MLFLKCRVAWRGKGLAMAKVAGDTKLSRVLKPDFGDLQKYLMLLSDRVISKKADKLISNKKD